jgi:hypothetical protein
MGPPSALHRFSRLDYARHFEAIRLTKDLRKVFAPFERPAAKLEPLELFSQRRPSAAPGGRSTSVLPSGRTDDMLNHVEDAMRARHPFVSPFSGLPPNVEEAIRLTLSCTRQLRKLMPPHVYLVARGVDLGLIAAILDAFPEWPHRDLVFDLVYGFITVGAIPDTGVHRPIDRPPLVDPTSVLDFNDSHSLSSIDAARRRSRQMPDQARELLRKTQAEVNRLDALGPFSKSCLDGVWGKGGWRTALRFAVLKYGKLRPCDDERSNLINAICALCETISRHGSPRTGSCGWWPMCTRSARRSSSTCSSARTIFAARTRRAPPRSRGSRWCLADPDDLDSEDVFYVVPGHNFGLVAAVTNFNSVMEFTSFFAVALLGLITDHFFDDVPLVDLAPGAQFAQDCLGAFYHMLGFPFDDGDKHVDVSHRGKLMGAISDISRVASEGVATLEAFPERLREVLVSLAVAVAQGVLAPSHAATIRGKLQFTNLVHFDRVGRTALPVLRRHAAGASTTLSPSTAAACEFLVEVLIELRPFEFRVRSPCEHVQLVRRPRAATPLAQAA